MKLTSMFQNNPKTKTAIIIFVGILIAAFATKCAYSTELTPSRSAKPFTTSSPSLYFNMGTTVIRQPAPVIGLTVNYPDRIGDIDYEFGFALVGATDSIGNNFGINLRLVDGWGAFRVGFGVAYLQHTDWINGSNLNFNLLAGLRLSDRWSVDYSHWSNAGTVSPNLGRDMVLLNYRFN